MCVGFFSFIKKIVHCNIPRDYRSNNETQHMSHQQNSAPYNFLF